MTGVERYQIVIVGAGAAGEAAAEYARSRDASVAVVDRELYGGSCPFWACMPSKALLHAASVHHAGGDYPWPKASDFRDWMINREGTEWPDDASHVRALTDAGATVIRGAARFAGPHRLTVATDDGARELEADAVVLAVGSHARMPDLPGLADVDAWTNREGTGTRDLPKSLVILGAGPTGVELSQVYARYGVPTTIVHPRDHINDRDHPRSSELLAKALEREGVRLCLGRRAVRAERGDDGAALVVLDDGSTLNAHAILMAIGREVPLAELNLESIGVTVKDGRVRHQDLKVADGVWVAGDIAGPEMHTHLAHYEGEMAVRLALGEDVAPDLRAIPRATYTDPETASVGLLVEEARERGIDALEFSADLATSAKGYVSQAEGHVTIVVDRARRTLVGAFLAGPGVSETVHEAVLAVKTATPIDVLADTIHAFPTVARVLGSLFIRASREL
jgi:pyruvate/2-oxoglutarate dehydrogenase complex dihydrolipoamide dehydrogenase (E3) component